MMIRSLFSKHDMEGFDGVDWAIDLLVAKRDGRFLSDNESQRR